MSLRNIIIILSLTLSLQSCDFGWEKTAKEENQEMVTLLAETHSRVVALDITFYYNTKRAQALDSIRKVFKSQPEQYSSYTYWYTREVLNSGDTESSIVLINDFYQELEAEGKELTKQWNYFFQRLLAISNIRLGEQVNCLINHTSSSCILPVAGSGVHLDEAGSRAAIAIIEELLIDYPEDLELVWLLNICYQTIGEYPQSVPEQYLIPETSFEDNKDLLDGKFEDIAPQVGVDNKAIAGGSILEDFNNDGFLDIVATSSGITPSDQMRIYINNGKGGFDDKTVDAALSGLVGGLNTVQTDYNNDGFIDIFVLRGGWLDKWGQHPNSLLRNNGDGTFTDVTKAAGLLSFKPTQTAVWADFNNDGWLDLFIGNESSAPPGRERLYANRVHESEFYVNNQDGTFTDIAAEKGVNVQAMIKGVTAINANQDDLIDLYISVNNGRNYLFINKGNMDFEEETLSFKVPEPYVSFPVVAFDYNNDGLEDLFVCGYSTSDKSLSHEIAYEQLGNKPTAALPKLYRNNGDNTFSDVTNETKLNRSIYGMGFNFGDLDNDGFLDLYFGTGDPNFESIIPNRMFKNMGGKYFEEVSFVGGFSNIQKGHGISWGDIDNDGDEDIYINMGGAHEGDIYQNQLLRNPLKSGNWLNVRLKGVESNRAAVGVKLHAVTSTGQHLYRRVSSGASFGANSYAVEFGLGEADALTLLEITWPVTGKTQKFSNLSANQFLEITEGSDTTLNRELKKIEFEMTNRMNHDNNHD